MLALPVATNPPALVKRVHVGDTPQRVRAVLGRNYVICTVKNSPSLCKEPVWLYQYADGGLGLAVRFHDGRVIRVLVLHAVSGWKR